jgi:hypothetical protein
VARQVQLSFAFKMISSESLTIGIGGEKKDICEGISNRKN